MLPIAPPGGGNSPYNAFSAFAGNPMLLSLDVLKERGYLKEKDLHPPVFPKDQVDFGAAQRFKWPVLLKAFEAFEAGAGASAKQEFEAFCKRNEEWLEDYALFDALKEEDPSKSWVQWEPGLRSRDPKALQDARQRLAKSIRIRKFLQHEFFAQWNALRQRCAELGVGLIGDIPIFVAHDSADVWSRPEIFWIDPKGHPLKVAGVPPDYFSKTGQLWGNPLYRWKVLRSRGYDWWISRFRTAFECFDVVRLDHFIGFYNYWEIRAGSKTAEHGRWVLGPGEDLFDKARQALGPIQFIAEDLGVLTDEVADLRDRLGFPGLRVLQFGFGSDEDVENLQPDNVPERCVVYTGTHDNDTTMGWFRDKGGPSSTRSEEQVENERSRALAFLDSDGHEFNWDLIRLALISAADTAIIPMQDLLGLGSEARMNRPGTTEGNWNWRMREGAFSGDIARRLAELTDASDRRPSH
jgi:4-alpha-glucanotransferase